MRLGVVCEGPSDFPAMENFIGTIIQTRGHKVEFISLYPEMDKTRPEGGWGHIFNWLAKYPAESRVQNFFGGGLFGGDLIQDSLDAIIFQMDTDVLEDPSFGAYIVEKYGLQIVNCQSPKAKAAELVRVMKSAMAMHNLCNADRRRHVIFPAVESTEAWCVVAFQGRPQQVSLLTGNMLTNAFMSALEASEGKVPKDDYQNVDKSLSRRARFCEKHRGNSNRLLGDCEHFEKSISRLLKYT